MDEQRSPATACFCDTYAMGQVVLALIVALMELCRWGPIWSSGSLCLVVMAEVFMWIPVVLWCGDATICVVVAGAIAVQVLLLGETQDTQEQTRAIRVCNPNEAT